ncbi:MAG: acyltransferase family protein [Acidimicrobiales bacterium]
MPRHSHAPSASRFNRGDLGDTRLGYMPALDGVRACAVLAVMAYHGGISFMPGGFFGVDAFFVLSGFLITSLLLVERFSAGRVALRGFWARRARRLLPALLVMLVAVVLYARFVAAPGSYPDLRADAFSAMFYVANWHFIAAGQNYFIATGLVSPLLHTWSLAIEEQFYIVWPIIVLVVLRTGRLRRTKASSIRALLVLSLAGAAASAIEMAVIYQPGVNATRVYFGSDTHAQCLLVGTALACAVALWRERGKDHVTSVTARTALSVVAVIGLGVCAWAWTHLYYNQSFVFRGGFAIVAVSVAGVVLCAVLDPAGAVAWVLSLLPLRYLGKISYGLYLWHFPIDIALNESRIGFGGIPLFLVRSATAVAIATVSFYAIERPIRTGTFVTSWRVWIGTPAALAATAVVLVLATATPAVAVSADARKPAQAPVVGSHKVNHDLKHLVSYSNDPVRVLVVGDSVALTLAQGLSYAESSYHIDLYNEGIIGCGVAVGAYYQVGGVISQSGAPCTADPGSRECFLFKRGAETPCISWEAAWQKWLSELKPNVVVLLAGRWEVMNRTDPQGQWTNILNPSFAEYIKQQLEAAVQVATSTGAKMVIETAPCFDSGEQPDGAPWPEDSAARLSVYNHLVDQVGAQYPTKVTVQNLDEVVCPGGAFTTDLHGVPVRNADGVHFLKPTSSAGTDDVGGEYLAPALLPLWEQLGHAQEAESGGATIATGTPPSPFFLSAQ